MMICAWHKFDIDFTAVGCRYGSRVFPRIENKGLWLAVFATINGLLIIVLLFAYTDCLFLCQMSYNEDKLDRK